MVKKELELLGVMNGSNPLEVLVPAFEVKTVEQNTPLAAVVNTITVSIKANCDLLPGSTVTIHELTGSAQQTGSLQVVHGNGGFADSADWDISGNLTLTSAEHMQRRETYEARFNLTNPPTSQSSPGVMVRASVKSVFGDISPVVTTAMVKPGVSLLSVPNGFDPLEVHVPRFLISSIGQSHPFPGSSNLITVTLAASCDFEASSLVTISGLTGSLTLDDSPNFPVDTTSAQWYSDRMWVQSDGSLTLLLFNSNNPSSRYQMESYIAMSNNTQYVFWFHLRNPFTVQASPVVNVSAAVWSPWGPLFSPIHQVEMTKEHATVLQVPTASDPLFVWNTTFITQIMAQSNPLSKASNTLTVTLQTNFEVLSGSNITITGLTGSLTPDTIRLGKGESPIENPSHSPNRFSTNFSRWTQADGELVLLVSSSLNAFESYIVEFELRNPVGEQENPLIYLKSTLESNLHSVLVNLGTERFPGFVNTSSMTLAREFRFGIENASLPFLSILPIFEVSFIRQDFFYPNFTNTLSVSLKMNCNLTKNSVITISGLTNTLTSETQINVLETQDMEYKTHPLDAHQKLLTADGLRGTPQLVANQYGEVTDTGLGFHFESHAQWNQADGSLLIVIGGGTYVNTTYEVQFNLSQPIDNAGFPRNVTIKGHVETGAFDAPIYVSEMVQSTDPIYGLEGASAPLFTHQAKILNPVLTQQSPFPGIMNEIQARFTFDIDVVPGAKLTLSGFKSMQTTSTRTLSSRFGVRVLDYLPCEVRPFGSFAHECEFDQEAGQVILTTNEHGTRRSVEYHANFSLLNPANAYISDELWASANIPYQDFERSILGRASYGKFPRPQNVLITSKIFEVPRKILLGIEQTFLHKIESVDAGICNSMADGCSLGDLLHTCSFDRDMATEIAGCLVRCNTSAAIIGSNAVHLRSACCGLQCLDNCWARTLNDTRPLQHPHASCPGAVEKTCPNGVIPNQIVSLMRSMPYDMPTVLPVTRVFNVSGNCTDPHPDGVCGCDEDGIVFTPPRTYNATGNCPSCTCDASGTTNYQSSFYVVPKPGHNLSPMCNNCTCDGNGVISSANHTNCSLCECQAQACDCGCTPRICACECIQPQFDSSDMLQPNSSTSNVSVSYETPFSHLEKEHVFEIQVAAVLSPPCLNYDSPWQCHTWQNGSLVRSTTGPRLTGAVVSTVDILTGQATFTDLTIVDATPGMYKILFYVANATVAHFQGKIHPGNLCSGSFSPHCSLTSPVTISSPFQYPHSLCFSLSLFCWSLSPLPPPFCAHIRLSTSAFRSS